MTVYGISMMRDEADVARQVIEHMLTQVDRIIVLDDGSTDGTEEILTSLPITVVYNDTPGFWQSRKMTGLAHMAGDEGATWIVPFDADELWSCPNGGRLGNVLESLPSRYFIAEAKWYDYLETAEDDPTEPDPFKRMCWRLKESQRLRKVACRYRPSLTIVQGNHSAWYDLPKRTIRNQIVVRHYPYRGLEHFIRKSLNGAVAYDLTDLPESMGVHWRKHAQAIQEGGEQAAKALYSRFYLAEPRARTDVIYSPAPIGNSLAASSDRGWVIDR
jgi:hypothetical protein